MKNEITIGIGIVAAFALACGREHLAAGHGRAYREQFAIQQEKPKSTTKVTPGLDAQEASIIASTYRASLAPKEERQRLKDEPILVVTPPQRGATPQLPLPSVPKE